MEVSKISPGLAKAVCGFSWTHGARLMDSTPPATTMSAAPDLIIWLARMMALSPEEQSRFTVMPGMWRGSPARMVAIRATLRFSSPAPLALPRITSSIAVRIDSGPGHGLTDHQRGQIIRPDRGERTAVSADRRAGTANKKSLDHENILYAGSGAGTRINYRPFVL